MTTHRELAIVIPFYNEEAVLRGTLDSLYDQQDHNSKVILVDNASTDSSREVIDTFSQEHPDFPLSVVEESQKGTGAAADTGFKEAIERGHALIARTDADTHPRSDWSLNIQARMHNEPGIQLLGGVSKALRDEHYQRRDDLIAPALLKMGRVALSIKMGSRLPLKMVVGHNMATRAEAYQETGGFPRTSIVEADEDKVYSEAVFDLYGYRALDIDPNIVVHTSARRLRKIGGYTSAFAYYFNNDAAYRLEKTDGNIDVR